MKTYLKHKQVFPTYIDMLPKLVPRIVKFDWFWYRLLKYWYCDSITGNERISSGNTASTLSTLSLLPNMSWSTMAYCWK